jgi:hypothetical protein
MPPTRGSSGMGDRKKRTLSALPLGTSSSSTHRHAYHNINQRSPSPPASAYFPLLSADHGARLRPTPDAEAHFAYSTTLRRHQSEASALASPAHLASAVNAEASSLWSRAVGAITGQRQDDHGGGMENGRTSPAAQREEKKDTASARFAHYSVEVCFISLLYAHSKHPYRIRLPTSEPQQKMAFCTPTSLTCERLMATMNSQSLLPSPCFSNSPRQFTRVH